MPLDIDKEPAALERMTTGQLANRFAELFGELTHSRHRTYLIRKILWKMQTREAGGLSERAVQRAKELAKDTELRVMPPAELEPRSPVAEVTTTAPVTRDKRLPLPGAALIREYKGQRIEVTVLPDGFEYQGKRYRTLSAVAPKTMMCPVYELFSPCKAVIC